MHMENRFRLFLIVIGLVAILCGCAGKSASIKGEDTAKHAAEAQRFVDEARTVLANALKTDTDGSLKELVSRAKGVMIIPSVADVSLLFSVGGGYGVVLANTDAGWTGPVFLSKGTFGFGAQAGFFKQVGVMLFMHEDDIRYLLKTGGIVRGQARAVILNGDFKANETPEFYQSGDVYFVGEHTGLYLGIAIDGGGFSDRVALNETYCGVEGGGPMTILYKKKVMPDGAQELRDMLESAGAKDAAVSETEK